MVHWDRKAYRRRLFLQILILLSLLVAVSLAFLHKQNGFDQDAKTLVVLSKEIIPLKEVSGMVSFLDHGKPEIAFIGDSKSSIYLKVEDKEYSFKDLLIDRFSLCQSDEFDECSKAIKKLSKNWEGLAIDGQQRFFAIQEHSQSVVVLNRAVDKIEHALHFNFARAFSDAVAKGSKKIKKNTLGEGLILLKQGHMIVSKEAFPVAFVEFGPEGDQALGLNAETVLGETEAFLLDEASFHINFVPLATWVLAAHGKCDISDLALDEDRSLLALSEDCLTIQRYPVLVPGQDAKATDVYVIPGEVRSPEALVVRGKEWLVGSDVSKQKQYNFYRLGLQTGLR
ncbi:MAG: hypothetical protein H7318_09015 [Oligoflexus sp.]|nr:hypothetical protein [Oligoflexus sp.]